MKPDSDNNSFNIQANLNPKLLASSTKVPIKNRSVHNQKKLNSPTLKQHIDNIPKHQWIADNAYYKSEARGFLPGREVHDWLEAEQDYIKMLVDMYLNESKEDGNMTLIGLKRLAKAVGVKKTDRIQSKIKLIRLIQLLSRNRPCYMLNPGEFCPKQENCQWSTECQKLVAEWCR